MLNVPVWIETGRHKNAAEVEIRKRGREEIKKHKKGPPTVVITAETQYSAG